MVDGDLEYEVDKILAHNDIKGKRWFLVKWSGYSEEHNTWEPEKNMTHCKEILAEYWKPLSKGSSFRRGVSK
jgi:hypothetical protein